LGRIAGRLARVPLVVNTQHGLYAQPSDRWQRRVPVYVAERLAAAASHVELVQNEEDVHTLVHTLRVPRRKVRLLGNGIDLQRFAPERVDTADRERVRSQWGVAHHEVVFGTVGRLVAEKGIAELVEAAGRLRATGLPVRFVVVGPLDIDKGDALPPDFVDRAVADGVVFTGRRDDMPQCYAGFDVFVSASWREGFPRAAMEAAAMGLPTIATDIRGNRQVVVDGVTGLMVPVRSAPQIATACEHLARDPDARRVMGAAAARRALEEFGDQRVIERTLDAYRLLGT
jgi:glycosyltransferase involved in cell wall biosynthesis